MEILLQHIIQDISVKPVTIKTKSEKKEKTLSRNTENKKGGGWASNSRLVRVCASHNVHNHQHLVTRLSSCRNPELPQSPIHKNTSPARKTMNNTERTSPRDRIPAPERDRKRSVRRQNIPTGRKLVLSTRWEPAEGRKQVTRMTEKAELRQEWSRRERDVRLAGARLSSCSSTRETALKQNRREPGIGGGSRLQTPNSEGANGSLASEATEYYIVFEMSSAASSSLDRTVLASRNLAVFIPSIGK